MSRLPAPGRLLPVLAILPALAAPAAAADADGLPGVEVRGELPFLAGMVSRPDSAGTVTRLLIEVPEASLVRPPSGDPVPLRIVALVRDGSGSEVGGGSWSETAGPPGSPVAFAGGYDLRLPAGTEVRVLVLCDQQDRDHGGEAELRYEVPRWSGEKLALSEILLGKGCAEGFRPHPGRVYGDSVPELCFEASVLDRMEDRPETEYAYRVRVRDARGRTLVDEEGAFPREGGRGELELTLDLEPLVYGPHRIDLEVELGGEKAGSEAAFLVDASRVAPFSDPRKIRTVLGYVATSRELRELEQTRDEDLAGLWDRFWERRDPVPGTSENEALALFQARVDYAERHYGDLEPGWHSDRGRIYIQYGPPDEIETPRDGTFRVNTEVWIYRSRNLTFVFQDRDGYGAFRLVGTRRY